jgi:hypothetical protein
VGATGAPVPEGLPRKRCGRSGSVSPATSETEPVSRVWEGLSFLGLGSFSLGRSGSGVGSFAESSPAVGLCRVGPPSGSGDDEPPELPPSSPELFLCRVGRSGSAGAEPPPLPVPPPFASPDECLRCSTGWSLPSSSISFCASWDEGCTFGFGIGFQLPRPTQEPCSWPELSMSKMPICFPSCCSTYSTPPSTANGCGRAR